MTTIPKHLRMNPPLVYKRSDYFLGQRRGVPCVESLRRDWLRAHRERGLGRRPSSDGRAEPREGSAAGSEDVRGEAPTAGASVDLVGGDLEHDLADGDREGRGDGAADGGSGSRAEDTGVGGSGLVLGD